MAKKIEVLFMSASNEVGGAEKVLLDILALLDKEKYSFTLLNQSEGEFNKRFRELGGKTVSFQLPAWRKQKCFFSRLFALIRLLVFVKKQKINLVHCNAYRLAPYLKWLQRLCSVKGFVHVHDLLSMKKAKKFSAFAVKDIVAVSDAVAGTFREAEIHPEVIVNGVDTHSFKAVDSNEKKFNCVGMMAHFHPIKRHGLFVDIALELSKINSDANFLLVGDDLGENKQSLKKCRDYSAQKGLKKITFTGRVDNPHEYMQKMDIFLLTSKEEACPLVILEAMAAGCIVIADKNAGGTCSLICDGVDGFLVDCLDVRNTAEKINGILSDHQLMKRIALNARMKIEDRFSFEVFASNFDNYYDSLLSKVS